MDSLENWWLDFRKCYLMGEPDDPSDAYLLNRLVSEALSVVKETKRTPSSDEETSLRLLISSHSSMINAQVVRGVMNIFGVSAKSELVTNLLAYFRTVQTELQHLKAVKRKPVFLILDKVTKYLFISLYWHQLFFLRLFNNFLGKAWLRCRQHQLHAYRLYIS